MAHQEGAADYKDEALGKRVEFQLNNQWHRGRVVQMNAEINNDGVIETRHGIEMLVEGHTNSSTKVSVWLNLANEQNQGSLRWIDNDPRETLAVKKEEGDFKVAPVVVVATNHDDDNTHPSYGTTVRKTMYCLRPSKRQANVVSLPLEQLP